MSLCGHVLVKKGAWWHSVRAYETSCLLPSSISLTTPSYCIHKHSPGTSTLPLQPHPFSFVLYQPLSFFCARPHPHNPPPSTHTASMASASTPAAAPVPSFLDLHRPQLESLGFPPALYARLEAKLVSETFDAGNTFGVVEDETKERLVVCSAAQGVDAEADCWLIDHFFSFRVETYRQDLKDRPELLARLAAMMGLGEGEEAAEEEEEEGEEATTEQGEERAPPSTALQDEDLNPQEEETTYDEAALPMRRPDPREKPTLYEQVCEQIWRFASSYRLVDPRDPFKFKTVWFVNDEFGSAFQHASPAQCNFRVSPFIYLPPAGGLHGAMAFSLAWPVARIEEGEECTRDYAFGCDKHEAEEEGDALLLKRECQLATWFEMPSSVLAQFKMAHARKQELLDMLTQQATTTSSSPSSSTSLDTHFSRTLKHTHSIIKLYSDNNQVIRSLNRPEFTHVDSPSEADIVWVYHSPITASYRQEQGLKQEVVLSQTLGDECLVFKHLLPLTAARCQGYKAWLPLTYNMEKEAAAFIHEYRQRQQHHQEQNLSSLPPSHPPLFILKPWNLGRSLDSAVADSLPQALQLARTCPKIASEYIHDIATVNGKKFDVRYRLMVRSWEPLEVFRWVHWGLRVSNHAYSLKAEDINDFEVGFVWEGGRGRGEEGGGEVSSLKGVLQGILHVYLLHAVLSG